MPGYAHPNPMVQHGFGISYRRGPVRPALQAPTDLYQMTNCDLPSRFVGSSMYVMYSPTNRTVRPQFVTSYMPPAARRPGGPAARGHGSSVSVSGLAGPCHARPRPGGPAARGRGSSVSVSGIAGPGHSRPRPRRPRPGGRADADATARAGARARHRPLRAPPAGARSARRPAPPRCRHDLGSVGSVSQAGAGRAGRRGRTRRNGRLTAHPLGAGVDVDPPAAGEARQRHAAVGGERDGQ
jgi:hypothetical protein